jgi:peptide/nickel transport system permease protein
VSSVPVPKGSVGQDLAEEVAGAPAAFEVVRRVWNDRRTRWGMLVIFAFLLLAVIGPYIAPHEPFERLRDHDGQLLRLESPSFAHPFGTSNYGADLLSQTLHGIRRSLQIGVISAVVSVVIGTNVGLLAGYFGGWLDQVLMRLTDVAFSLPFLPLAIVLIGVLGRSDVVLTLAIAALFWRSTARIIRSQVLTLRERSFVKAAVCGGASDLRVLYRQIAPNVIPFSLLYGMLLTAEAVIAEATLSFLGFAAPDSISLGTIMFDAYSSQQLREAWWWTLFPGLLIMAFVFSTAMLARSYERTLSTREAGS